MWTGILLEKGFLKILPPAYKPHSSVFFGGGGVGEAFGGEYPKSVGPWGGV